MRAHGELVAAGFEVIRLTAPPGASTAGLLASATHGANAVAALGVTERGDLAWVWAPDPEASEPSPESVESPREPHASSAATLAIRAVELLRARITAAPSPPAAAPSPPPPPPQALPPSAPDPGPRIELAVGLASRFAFDGLGTALGPQLSAGVATASGWLARARFVGSLASETDAAAGHVDVREELGLLELGLGRHLDAVPLRLAVALGLGFAHTAVSGAPVAPLVPREDDGWAALGELTGEASFYPTDMAFVSLDGALLLAAPRTTVALGGEELGTLGRPSLLLGARAGLSF